MPYDRTSDSTEEWIFLNYHKHILKSPDPNWHFDKDELNEIALIYLKLQKDAGIDIKQELPTKSLSMILHKAFGMADDALMQRIFSALDEVTSTVTLRGWISAMSLFLRASLKQKIKYCFKVYDIANKFELRRDHLVHLMRTFVYKHHEEDIEEAVKDLADILVKKMDLDRDGIISYQDYITSVEQNPMLLECLGQCLPDRTHVYAFLLTFTDKIKDF
jgi:Ca2+-binding EF-hand superfamily protein